MSRPWRSFFLALAVAASAGAAATAEPPDAGAIVYELAPDSAAARAGLRVGDVLLSWYRAPTPANPQPASGAITSPFDVLDLWHEEAPRGPVTLSGRRGTEDITWPAFSSARPPKTRPVLSPPLAEALREGQDLLQAGKAAEAAERWSAAAAQARGEGETLHGVWLLLKSAEGFATARVWPRADASYESAIQELEREGLWRSMANYLETWAGTFRTRNDWGRAEDNIRRALDLEPRLGPESLALARARNWMGVVARDQGDLEGAEAYWRRALSIAAKWAPESFQAANDKANLAKLAYDRGDLATTEALFKQVLDVGGGGHLPLVADALSSLSTVAQRRGDIAAAEVYVQRALDIVERHFPGTHDLGHVLNAAGEVTRARGSLVAATRQFRRGLALAQARPPEDLALAVRSLVNLADVSLQRGLLGPAEQYAKLALSKLDALPSARLQAGNCLQILGLVAERRGCLSEAEGYHRQVLALWGELTPGTSGETEALHALGRVERRKGRPSEAAALFLRALDALESQKAKAGGTLDQRFGFAARYAGVYHDAIEVHVELGRVPEALRLLERSRARTFLDLLAERDVVFSADLPPELARERRLADVEYDQAQAALFWLDPVKDRAEVESAQARLRRLREKQEEIAVRVRKASPRLAALQYPEPLDLAGVEAALDPGTVFLAYSVGERRTLVFAVRPGAGVSVASIAVGEKALRRKVEAFRKALQEPQRVPQAALRVQGAELYRLLVRPAERQIAAGERLLICPDGPLHSLPFAALVRGSGPAPKVASHLVEWKPLHVVASATVYQEIKRSRRAKAGPDRLVAFGDPRYPAVSKPEIERLGNPEVRSVLSRGLELTPLPWTRVEVQAIADLFPAAARTYLGDDATEERAKSLSAEARYVHFACHGSLDERFPLNSALALTIPENPGDDRDNGLLQAWEIFDRVRLDAELVTLSACQTGLGKEMGGEGLLGLTRAFQYAGARSVLASLWAVSDKSTSRLMASFYAHLKEGQTRDVALRSAQVDMIRRGAHPFRWAAFQISGDWR